MRAALLILLLTIGFYWKVALTNQYVWFDHPDTSYMQLPRLEFMAREIHSGRFPLWDPHIWMGQPLVGQTQPGPLNPLNVLFLMLPLEDGYIRTAFLNWYFVLMHAIAALGAYALCRELRRSRAASLLGACAYSFGGFLASVPWLDVMSGALWTPLVCLFFVRAARGARAIPNAALSGLFLGVAWLSGHHEVPLLTTAALGVAWLAVLFRRGRTSLAPALATFVVAGLTAAAQLWPTLEFGRLARRWGPPEGPVGWKDAVAYLSSEMYSLTPRGLAGVLVPDQGTIGDVSGFLGVVGVSLAVLGVWAAWKLPPVRWCAALGGAALLYAMGGFTPLHGILYATVPELQKVRLPVRALHLVSFALALLAAHGADQLLRRRALPWMSAWAKAAGALGGALLLAATVKWLAPGDLVSLSAAVAVAFCIAVLAWRGGHLGRRACAAVLLFLMLVELHAAHTRGWQNRYSPNAQRFARSLEEHRDVARFLLQQPGHVRAVVNDQDVPVNFGDLHSIPMLEGYLAGVTENLLRFGRHMPRQQQLYGATHYVGKAPHRPGLVEEFAGEGGIKVFRIPDAFPRARAVHEVAEAADAAGVARLVDDPAFDPARAVALAGDAPPLERCAGDDVAIAAYAPNRVRIRAAMACRGMVVLADTWYPGWRAFVDGRETRIWEAYGSVRGVVVEAGAHHVEFVYRPASVLGGLALTAAGMLAALAAALSLAGRKRRRLDRSRAVAAP